MRKSGTSLVEMIVALAILSLVLLAVYILMFNGLRYYQDSEAKLELQRQSLLAIHRVSRKVSETSRYSVETGTNALLFAYPRDDNGYLRFTSDRSILWYRFFCYYLTTMNGQSVLVSKEFSIPTPPDSPPKPSDFGLSVASVVADNSLPVRVVARGITKFETKIGSDSLQIDFEAKNHFREDFILEFGTKISPRH